MKGMILGATWNAFLALIPLVAALILERVSFRFDRSSPRTSRLWLIPLGIVWLAFLPNTCYLMTEWRHFLFDAKFKAVRESVDPNSTAVLKVALHAACFLLYSGFGVICFVLAVRPVSELFRRWGLRPSRLAVPFFFATSLGVYLGLIVRLNSWDLAVRPGYVLRIALGTLVNPPLLVVLVGFAVVLWLMYLVMDIWMTGLEVKIRKTRASQVDLNSEKYRIVPR